MLDLVAHGSGLDAVRSQVQELVIAARLLVAIVDELQIR